MSVDVSAAEAVETAPLRIAFASGVRHAVPYLEIFAGDRRVQLVGIAEEADAPDWMRADSRAAAAATGVPWFENIDDLIDRAATDLVVVCSEPTRHARLAIRALQAGLHVLVDKPAATTIAEADAVLAAAESASGACAVVNRTFAPELQRTRAWVDAGHLGLPRHVDMEFLASGAFFATSVERPELVVDPAFSGGGEMLNFLGYCADAVMHLTGLAVTSVYAMSGTLFEAGHAAFDVEDTAVVSLGLEHGVTSTITVGRIPFAPGFGPTSTSIRLLGSHGHAVIDDDKPRVMRFAADGAHASAVGGGGSNAALVGYLTHVVDCLTTGRRLDYGIAEARRSLAVIDAAYRSVQTGAVTEPR